MVSVVVEGHDLHVGVVSTNHRAEVVADEIRLGGGRVRGRFVTQNTYTPRCKPNQAKHFNAPTTRFAIDAAEECRMRTREK